jgi:hypothetical protein
MGLATANITNGVNGTVMSFGTLKDIDTRGSTASAIAVGDETWAAGDILFAHPTVDGKLTKVRPQHDLVVAFITVRHASAGQLAVRITSGNHLEWLHDVAIEDPANDQILAYDETAGLWKNIDIPESAAVISSATAPVNTSAIWYNTENGNAYIYYDSFWTSVSGASGMPITSDTAPTNPVAGMQWFNSLTGKTYLYFSSAWIEIDSNGTAATSTGNAIINGAFEINQRNFTSTTSDNVFMFDRWITVLAGNGTSTFSRETFTPGAAPFAGYEGSNFLRVITTGQSSSAVRTTFTQRIEDVRTFAGQTVTLSFFARSGSGTPKLALELFQDFRAGDPSVVLVTAQQVTLSTTFTRYNLTFTVPSISGRTIGTGSFLGLNVFASAGSDFNARTGSLGIQSNTFDIWGVQLEAGAVATPFRRNAPSIQAELAACQRYYYRTSPYSSGLVPFFGTMLSNSSSSGQADIPLPVTMRVPPTSIEWASVDIAWPGVNAWGLVSASLSTGYTTQNNAAIIPTTGTGLIVDGRPYWLRGNSNGAGFLGFSAEL